MFTISAFVSIIASVAVSAESPSVNVGVLAQHNPTAWSKQSSCSSSNKDFVLCNLNVFTAAIQAAGSAGVQMLVLPEGYGLSGSPTATGFYEELVARVGETPCDTFPAAEFPQQVRLSCAARNSSVAVSANLFTSDANGTRHITEIVFGAKGDVLAVYHKHHLFVTEEKLFEAGPFNPTTFAYADRVWGILICYEGFYPEVSGDWSQMDALKKANASSFVWSVGDTALTLDAMAQTIAKKYSMSIAGTEDEEVSKTSVALLDAAGKAVSTSDVNVPAVDGYSAKPIVRHGML